MIKTINSLYSEAKKDIRKTYESVESVLSEFNRYTDYDYQTYQKGVWAYDEWTNDESVCPSGYQHNSQTDAPTPDKHIKTCLLFKEWDTASASNRYSDTMDTSSNYKNVKEAVSKYYPTFFEYDKSNSDYLNQLKVTNDDIDTKFFTNVNKNLTTAIDQASALMDPLISSLSGAIGNHTIYDLLNCRKIFS
jgi:hypothetical protein